MQPAWLRPRGDCSFEYATVTDEVGPHSHTPLPFVTPLGPSSRNLNVLHPASARRVADNTAGQ